MNPKYEIIIDGCKIEQIREKFDVGKKNKKKTLRLRRFSQPINYFDEIKPDDEPSA